MVEREPEPTQKPTSDFETCSCSARKGFGPRVDAREDRVALPTSRAGAIEEPAPLVLLVENERTVQIAGKSFTLADDKVDDLFRAVFVHDMKTQVVLEVHKGVSHHRVVYLMERAKAAGLTRLAIGTSGGS